MTEIDPKRLCELRHRKGLSRRNLASQAHVSERQLARIENSSEPRSVREHTLQTLARSLEVAPGVLTGDEPLPNDMSDAESRQGFDPRSLRAFRESKGMTQAELAKEAHVSVRQIARLETQGGKPRASTLTALAKALDTFPQNLGMDVETVERKDEPVQVGARVSPQLRLAYDLVRHRYGPSRRELIELAPLLFTLLAEGCLDWRRQCLEKMKEAKEEMDKLGKLGPLYFANYLARVDHGRWLEQVSIDSADLLGDSIRKDDQAWFYFSEDDLDAITPFSEYLRKLAEELKDKEAVGFFPDKSDATVGLDSIWGAEPYQVCGSLLDELCGGSKRARWALTCGDVQLAKIPPGLLKPDARDALVQWLESCLSATVREREEQIEKNWEELLETIKVQI